MNSTSLRALLPPGATALSSFANATHVPDRSVRRQASRLVVDRYHERLGGITGKLGLAMGDIVPAQQGFRRPYSGGSIELLDFRDGPKGYSEFVAAVRFCGYRVIDTNDASADEPYFILSVTGLEGGTNVTTRTIIDGSQIRSGNSVINVMELTTEAKPPFAVSATGMDHDAGDADEAADKVTNSLKEASSKVVAALTVIGAGAAGALVATFTSIFADTAGSIISAVFGMGDDHVGTSSKVISDYDAAQETWLQPRVVSDDPDFREPYNIKLELNNSDGGNYNAYFHVTISKVTREIQPQG